MRLAMRGKARSAAAPVASRKNGLRGIFMVMPQSLSIFPGTISIISNADLNVRFWHKADISRLSANVCFWHKADIPTRSTNVRFWG